MLYVQKITTVAVPKVYALYTESCTGRNFTVMEYIEGSTLASASPDLNALQKSTMTAKLRNFYNEIRQLPSLGYFGSLGRRPLLDETFWTRENVPSISGPFETEDVLNEALAQKYTYDGRAYYKAEYYRQSLPHVFRGNQPTSPTETVSVRILWSARFPLAKALLMQITSSKTSLGLQLSTGRSRAGIQVTGSTVLRSLLLDGMMIGAFF